MIKLIRLISSLVSLSILAVIVLFVWNVKFTSHVNVFNCPWYMARQLNGIRKDYTSIAFVVGRPAKSNDKVLDDNLKDMKSRIDYLKSYEEHVVFFMKDSYKESVDKLTIAYNDTENLVNSVRSGIDVQRSKIDDISNSLKDIKDIFPNIPFSGLT